MIITKSKLQQIIREELIKTLVKKNDEDLQAFLEGQITEKEFLKRLGRKALPYAIAAQVGLGSLFSPGAAARPPPAPTAQTQVVSTVQDSFLRAFYEAYPQAKDKEFNENVVSQVAKKEQEIKNKIKEQYSSAQRRQAFVKFIHSFPRFANETKEAIEKKYDKEYLPEIIKIIDSTLIQLINEGQHTDRMYRTFNPKHEQSGGQVTAAYDEETKTIIINPYYSDYMVGGEISWLQLENSIKEEMYHAIDDTLSKTIIPMSKLQKQAAEKLDIFLSQPESGISKERYDYLTSSHEFYAKMLRLKDIIAEVSPDKIDEEGKINQEYLFKLVNGDLKDIKDPTVIEILQVLDPLKIDKISKYFDMLAKVKTPTVPSSQIA